MSRREELLSLLSNDPLNILDDSKSKKVISKEDTTLLNSFEEIVDFVEEFGCEPQSNLLNVQEFQLYSRLQSIRSDARKVNYLKSFDLQNLLSKEGIKEMTIEDIISNDPFGLLDNNDEVDIYDLKNVKKSERVSPYSLSRRKFCKDFIEYEEMFKTLNEELKTRKRKLVIYNSTQLYPQRFYVLNGILLYLKDVEGEIDSYKYDSGSRFRYDGRTTCIFDNGTESDMLYRSLDKALQKDGYSISEKEYAIQDNINVVCEEDQQNGFIYILRTKNPNLQGYEHLYKIGCTTTTVQDRIKNAKKEATYLFSEVEVVTMFRCYNILSYNLEQKIHDFFNKVRLDIDIYDSSGKLLRPKEWFAVNLELVKEAIALILSDKIETHEYDNVIDQIIRKS